MPPTLGEVPRRGGEGFRKLIKMKNDKVIREGLL